MGYVAWIIDLLGSYRDVVVEMLRLCPGDNMGQRSWMGSILLQAGRPKDALHFSQRWLEKKTRYDGSTPKAAGCDFATEPFKDPMPQYLIDDISQWTPACHLYCAALAAFKLWGDCELARQYFQLAIKLNPNVMMKILGKIEQPSTQSPSSFGLLIVPPSFLFALSLHRAIPVSFPTIYICTECIH